MSKFCNKCGQEVTEDMSFCNKCGNSLNPNNNMTTNTYSDASIPNRNIALAIVLSIVTCGIYGLYWICTMNDDANKASGEVNGTSGIMVIILGLVTCGIYSIYWNYQMGKKLFIAGQKHNQNISDNSIIYLVLSLFGLGIINYCLIQNDLNTLSS